MGCVRKRGKSWNAQVRIAGWRSFTKSFARKSDAISWIEEIENDLRGSCRPKVNVGEITLRDLLQKYGSEVSSNFNSIYASFDFDMQNAEFPQSEFLTQI